MPSHSVEDAYVARVVGRAAREYAREYLMWMRGGREGAPPEYSCTFYAAQEVRKYLESYTPYSREEQNA